MSCLDPETIKMIAICAMLAIVGIGAMGVFGLLVWKGC